MLHGNPRLLTPSLNDSLSLYLLISEKKKYNLEICNEYQPMWKMSIVTLLRLILSQRLYTICSLKRNFPDVRIFFDIHENEPV